MSKTLTLLLTIRALGQQGEKILGNRWLPFIDYLRNALRDHGTESELSSDELLVFTFPQGLAGFTVLLNALLHAKKEHDWRPASGPCPLQIFLDLIPPAGPEIVPLLPESNVWDTLQHEAIHISPALEQELLLAIDDLKQFPTHKIQADDSGFSKVIFFDHDVGNRPKLLAFRALPVSGKGPECFYCGMTSHHPSLCPSKSLTMSSWALADSGYLTFAELNRLYKKVFPEKQSLVDELATGVKTAQIRTNKELLTFISFFDISAVFQLRFLWNFVFSGYSQWDSIYLSDRIKIDNSNLNLGLDCLRVGQHEQALAILENENKRKDGARFAANIALAFCSLESNRSSDFVRYLNEARNLAHQNREIIYCNLLLSRYYELHKDFWNAKDAVTNGLKADYDCLDLQYRRIQLAVREGLTDREFKQLRSLIVGQKEIFMKALLDPQLLPIQGLVENILAQQHAVISLDAQKNIKSAQQEVLALDVWLPENDRRRTENKSNLEQLGKQLARKSYFDLLDVSDRSNGLFFTCRRLRKDNSDRLTQDIHQLGQRLEAYLSFWKGYGYKKFFPRFQASLMATIKKNQQASLLLRENINESTRKAIALSKQVHTDFTVIEKEYSHLLWVRTTLNGLKIFAKRLLISEISIITLVALMLPFLTSILAGHPSFSWLVDLASNKEVQKHTLIISTLFIAPFISLAWTMMDLQKK